MNRDSRVFVAGGSGLVGRAIVKNLKDKGFNSLVYPTHQELDLLDGAAVSDFYSSKKPEYVIVAAARVGGIKANSTYPADFLRENLVLQNNVIWNAHLSGVKKLLFLGSNCIYPREAPQPIREESFLTGPFEPTNEGYAVAKTAGIKLCEKIFEQYGSLFISCMPASIYGIYDHFEPERGHVIPSLIRRMHEAKAAGAPEVVVWGSGSPRREFMHADDLAEAIFLLMEQYEKKEFLNIGTGEDISIKELALLVKETVGYKGALVFDTTKPDGMPRKLLEASKIRTLGWTPKVALRDGLQQTYAWYASTLPTG